jgi:hypothetical protein
MSSLIQYLCLTKVNQRIFSFTRRIRAFLFALKISWILRKRSDMHACADVFLSCLLGCEPAGSQGSKTNPPKDCPNHHPTPPHKNKWSLNMKRTDKKTHSITPQIIFFNKFIVLWRNVFYDTPESVEWWRPFPAKILLTS